MLADPFVLIADWTTITADTGLNTSMPAIERGVSHSLYSDGPNGATNETWRLFIGHQFGRRNRYTARLTVSGLTPDLIIDGNNTTYSQSCYVVFDCPNTGPVNPYASGQTLPNWMLKGIGALLVSVDTADPAFARILAGET